MSISKRNHRRPHTAEWYREQRYYRPSPPKPVEAHPLNKSFIEATEMTGGQWHKHDGKWCVLVVNRVAREGLQISVYRTIRQTGHVTKARVILGKCVGHLPSGNVYEVKERLKD